MDATTSLITGVDFVSIATRDFEAALAFYGDVLGLPHTVTYRLQRAHAPPPLRAADTVRLRGR
jgi:catechol 2,3-dioxygenase-like lactoylglutathione lyase family enzyme